PPARPGTPPPQDRLGTGGPHTPAAGSPPAHWEVASSAATSHSPTSPPTPAVPHPAETSAAPAPPVPRPESLPIPLSPATQEHVSTLGLHPPRPPNSKPHFRSPCRSGEGSRPGPLVGWQAAWRPLGVVRGCKVDRASMHGDCTAALQKPSVADGAGSQATRRANPEE